MSLSDDSSRLPSPLAARIDNATLTYGGRLLFDGLDFALEEGLWTCLLGPTGVGKTSLLRLFAGLEKPDAGQARAGAVSYMAQQDLLMPWLTVIENTVIGSRLRAEPPDYERARVLLASVGLADRSGDYPRSLSGGMRQRVALARTLMEDRPLVLMDEPFSGLDAITRLRLQSLAVELLRGRTVLLVTHDPLEALRLGDRIHVMAGRPARINKALTPAGDTPRDPADPALLAHQAELLARLTAAADADADAAATAAAAAADGGPG